MYFNKIRHPANFEFTTLDVTINDLGNDIHRLSINGQKPWKNPSHAKLESEFFGDSNYSVVQNSNAIQVVGTNDCKVLLSGVPGETYGRCGDAWMLQFTHSADMRFYGLGEHSGPLEKTGQRVKFWNTDWWADFSLHEIRHGNPNPMYVAIPWLIIKQGDDYLGLLINHPGAVFMELASNFIWQESNTQDKDRKSFYIGAPDGDAEIYVIVGPTLPELTRKLQHLVGKTPLPPLWALGHHQCRWGYASAEDLLSIDQSMTEHEIPNDGLWLDIEYMDHYKVFTFDPNLWGDNQRIRKTLNALNNNGRRVVPILDPGVKVESGYAVCEDGLKNEVYCLNPAGKPYVGFVWPGQTYMPDYSLPETRDWWAGLVKEFAELGVGGAWLDMNDPSVGAVELDDMLFDHGAQPHEAYHNQYALGMAQASRMGFLAARPNERPFLLARSGYISSSRYTAIWTGDNVANWHHLQGCISISIGLALSGQPFNGPDVCGFADDTTPELAVAWYKCGFLFPFLRNHSMLNSKLQEPWNLGDDALSIITQYIRLRYKLLPYLYQCFIDQEQSGEAILRPLFYDYSSTEPLDLDYISDQFMVGSDLMQAPVLLEGVTSRELVLPGDHRWVSLQDGCWVNGNQRIEVEAPGHETPLYVREGAMIPMQVGERKTQRNDFGKIELHCFLNRESEVKAELMYAFDDGISFEYQRGKRTSATFTAAVIDGKLKISIKSYVEDFEPLSVQFFLYDDFESVSCDLEHSSFTLDTVEDVVQMTGNALAVRKTQFVVLNK